MKIILFANTDWYLYNFRRSLALALREMGHDVLLVSPDGPYGQRLREAGLRWLPAPMERRSLNALRELRLILWLRRLMLAEKVDLVHAFTIKCAVYGSLAARLSNAKGVVNSVTGLGYVFTSRGAMARVLRPLVRMLLTIALTGSRTRLILQNDEDVALFSSQRIVPPERIRLIPGSGVDCERFSPALSPQCQQPLRVLMAARLLWDKGIAEYVSAAKVLHSARQGEFEFLLAGEPDPGNPSAVSPETLSGWVADGAVAWLGHVEDMPSMLRSVDVFVLPSYREGLSKALIEAAASGLPLVTSDAPGCRDVVTHDVDGLLVPIGDSAALVGALERLMDDAPLRERLARAARRKALAHFDERLVISRTQDVYREVLQG